MTEPDWLSRIQARWWGLDGAYVVNTTTAGAAVAARNRTVRRAEATRRVARG